MNLRWHGYRWGAAILLAAAVCTLGVYLLRGVLFYPYLKKAAVDYFQSDLNLQLALDDISGSLFTGIEFTNLRISTPEPADTPLKAAVPILRLRYRFFDLFRGIDAFIGGLSIKVDRPTVHIDLSRPSSRPPAGDNRETFGGLPENLPRVSIHDGHLDLKGDGYASRFGGISLIPFTGNGSAANVFQIAVRDWRWHLPPLRDGQVEAQARIDVEPSGRLAVHQLALNRNVLIEKGWVDLSQLPRNLLFYGLIPYENGSLTVRGRHDDEALALNVAGEDLDLALIGQIMDGPDLPLNGHVAIEADIRLPYAHPELLDGEMVLRAGAGQWKPLSWNHGRLHARAGEGILTVSQADWQSDGNSGRIRDLSLPTAALFGGPTHELLGRLTAAFDFSLENIPPLLALFGEGIHPAIGVAPPHLLVFKGHVQEGILTVSEGQLVSGGSTIGLQRLKTDLTALRGRATDLEAEATIDVPDLGDLAALLPLPPLSGQLQGDLSFDGSLQAPKGTVTLKGKNLGVAGVRLGDLDVFGLSDGARLTLETLALHNRTDRLNITGRVHLESGQLEDVHGALRIQNVGDYANSFLPAAWRAEGELDLQSAVEGTLLQPQVQAALGLSKAVLGALTAEKAYGRLKVTPNSLDVDRIEIRSSLGDILLAGRMDYSGEGAPLEVDVTEFALQRGDTAMQMSVPARISQGPDDRWHIEPLVLEGTAGRLRIAGDLGWPGQTDITISLDELSSGGWLGTDSGPIQSFSGLVARIHLVGTAAAHTIKIEGRLPRLIVREVPRPLQGRFDIAATADGIEIRQWAWSDGADAQLIATGHLPVVYNDGWQTLPGSLQLHAALDIAEGIALQGFMPDVPLTVGAVRARLDLAGTLGSPAGTLQTHIRDLFLALPDGGTPQGPFEAQATLRVHREGVDLENLDIASAQASLRGQGLWRADAPPVNWAAFRDQPPQGSLAASADFAIPDLGWLAGMVSGVQRITGRLNGSLKVDGPLGNPAIAAALALRGGSLQPEGDAPPLKSLQADLEADSARLTVRSFRGEIGGAPFEMAGDVRWADAKGWVTDFHLTGTNLLLYRTADIRVRADTELHLTGPVEKMALQGEVRLANSRFRRNVDIFGFLKVAPPSAGAPSEVLFSMPDPPLSDMTFDVNIDSKTPFELANNVVRGGLRPHLHLGGTGELPLLTGDVYLDPTRLRLPAGIMTIQSGVIRFLPSRANRPVMDLQGEGKAFDYDITVLIEGPLDEPQVTLSSSPPLPGDQLMLMLLTGQPPADKSSMETRGVPMNLAVYIGQDLLHQWFGGESESWASILDRFNVTVGRRVTRAGDETLEAEFRLGENVIRDGDSIYITGEKDIFDFYNAGVKFVFRFQ